MSRNKILKVYYNDLSVGSLAETADGRVAFEYDDLWVSKGFPISPFSLPLRKGVFVPGRDCPDGMFGVFRDSLPDAWGRLLVDRVLRKSGVNPADISMLDRLAIVGHSGMGALIYVPEWNIASEYEIGTLDEVAAACRSIFLNEETDYIDALYSMGGSSGGARPKILVSDHDGDWIIKFPSSYDSGEIGEQEYEYSKQSDFLKHDLCLVVYKTRHVKDIYSPEVKISDVSEVRRCIATGNDDQFIRLWFEVSLKRLTEELAVFKRSESNVQVICEKHGLDFSLRFSDHVKDYLAEQSSHTDASISDEDRRKHPYR